MRDDQILPHPETGHVTDDQRDPVAGPDAFPQGRLPDGRVQTFPKGGADIGNGRDPVPAEDGGNLPLVQGNADAAAAVGKSVLLHS